MIGLKPHERREATPRPRRARKLESRESSTKMAEAARHVNTMEAHHAPNWSRKQHVDGAHDKPSATSGSHGRKPHNATRPKTKHAPIDNESWSHADARAARLGRTESLSGYLFGSAFSAPERQSRERRETDEKTLASA